MTVKLFCTKSAEMLGNSEKCCINCSSVDISQLDIGAVVVALFNLQCGVDLISITRDSFIVWYTLVCLPVAGDNLRTESLSLHWRSKDVIKNRA